MYEYQNGWMSVRPEGTQCWAVVLAGRREPGTQVPSCPLKPALLPSTQLLGGFGLHTGCKHSFYHRKNCISKVLVCILFLWQNSFKHFSNCSLFKSSNLYETQALVFALIKKLTVLS